MCWAKAGTSFVIKDMPRFCADVLPTYFRHSNFSSFSRQLNFYSFKKVLLDDDYSYGVASASYSGGGRGGRGGAGGWLEFRHPYFVLGKPELLVKVRAKLFRALCIIDGKRNVQCATHR